MRRDTLDLLIVHIFKNNINTIFAEFNYDTEKQIISLKVPGTETVYEVTH
jgi:hypothetical protein